VEALVAVKLVLLIALGLISSSADARQRLSKSEARECHAKGGRESTTPFGHAFCQIDYPDGGKTCRGKADCQGQCLAEIPNNYLVIPVGAPVAGQCAISRSVFGCHGVVENGKLAGDGWVCFD
jgi:hypothetical protein